MFTLLRINLSSIIYYYYSIWVWNLRQNNKAEEINSKKVKLSYLPIILSYTQKTQNRTIFNEVAGFKISIEKSEAFLYISND